MSASAISSETARLASASSSGDGVASDPRDRRNLRPQSGDVGCYIPHAAEHGDFARLFENGHGGFGGYSLDFAVYKSVEHGVADAQYFQRRKFFQ